MSSPTFFGDYVQRTVSISSCTNKAGTYETERTDLGGEGRRRSDFATSGPEVDDLYLIGVLQSAGQSSMAAAKTGSSQAWGPWLTGGGVDESDVCRRATVPAVCTELRFRHTPSSVQMWRAATWRAGIARLGPSRARRATVTSLVSNASEDRPPRSALLWRPARTISRRRAHLCRQCVMDGTAREGRIAGCF